MDLYPSCIYLEVTQGALWIENMVYVGQKGGGYVFSFSFWVRHAGRRRSRREGRREGGWGGGERSTPKTCNFCMLSCNSLTFSQLFSPTFSTFRPPPPNAWLLNFVLYFRINYNNNNSYGRKQYSKMISIEQIEHFHVAYITTVNKDR